MRQNERVSGIKFHYLLPARIPASRAKAIVAMIFKNHGKIPIAVNFIFCSDRYLLNMNKAYLDHNTLTDILTFDLSDSPGKVTADIYISSERVRENAATLGTAIYLEFLRVIIHGALHLVGFRDKSRKEKLGMREEEEKYLSVLSKNVPRETKAKKKFHVKHRKGVA